MKALYVTKLQRFSLIYKKRCYNFMIEICDIMVILSAFIVPHLPLIILEASKEQKEKFIINAMVTRKSLRIEA